jgi:hypothetical protein
MDYLYEKEDWCEHVRNIFIPLQVGAFLPYSKPPGGNDPSGIFYMHL